MRWNEFKERTQLNNSLTWEFYHDPELVKELITDYTKGNMEQNELGAYLSAINATGDNLVEYFNSIQLNSFDKNLLRYLSEINNRSNLLDKYYNYSDKCYLYSNKGRILLPIIKQELADMFRASKSEEKCLAYFKANNYDMDEAVKKGFSLGNWKSDIQAFMDMWSEAIDYLESIVDITKAITQYFEIQLKEDPYKIREFFFENPLNFDFFLMLEIYDTFLRYHDFDKDIADEIAKFYANKNVNFTERLAISAPKYTD